MKKTVLFLSLAMLLSFGKVVVAQDSSMHKEFLAKSETYKSKISKVFQLLGSHENERNLGFATDADSIVSYYDNFAEELFVLTYEEIQGQKLTVGISFKDLSFEDFSAEVSLLYDDQNRLITLSGTVTEDGESYQIKNQIEYGYNGRVVSFSDEVSFNGFTITFTELLEIRLDEENRPENIKKYSQTTFGFLPPEKQLELEILDIQYDSENNAISCYLKEFFIFEEELLDSTFYYFENLEWYDYADQLLDWASLDASEIADFTLFGNSFLASNDKSHLEEWIGGSIFIWEEEEWFLLNTRVVNEISDKILTYSIVESPISTLRFQYSFNEKGLIEQIDNFYIPGINQPNSRITYLYNDFDLLEQERNYFLINDELQIYDANQYDYRVVDAKLLDYTTTYIFYGIQGEELYRFEERYEYRYKPGTTSTRPQTPVSFSQPKVFPNPFQSSLTIETNEAPLGRETWSLCDQNGKEIISWLQNPGQDQMQLDLKTLSPGLYILQNKTRPNAMGKKIIKK